MLDLIASRIMPRTTVNIDASVLLSLKRRARDEGKSLGELLSEIAARALDRDERGTKSAPLQWRSRAMGAKIDLEDKEALRDALDGR
jgi:hypothetical protein